MSASIVQMKVVWGIVTRGAQTIWSRVGVAWEGPNGALFVRLDAVPISGEMCIKEWGPAAEIGDDSRMAFGGVAVSPYMPAAANAETTS